ncbi:Cof-type HAD-IIB family hydrolase [Vibrio sp. S4M6]|uniref:Cof-type HAD-IIB family hydrolase n=1 Tax=Vibrio sinus TaxID=2946865 RepID=UPI002029BE5E|nr:Cof-type HAD-IIB family hydrolase [Vibrio sinus]MCL9783140.1 Cof-type HAD-IIB family hydrolase [Vibrio sinus]
MYKLVALDMDGTLLNERKEISQRTKDAISRAQSIGVKFVLASGRPLEGMLPYLEQLGIQGDNQFVVHYNGSLVTELGSGEVIYQQILSGKNAKEVHALAEQLKLHCHAFSLTQGAITPKENPYSQIEARVNGIKVTEVDFDALEDEHPIIKAMIVDDESKLTNAIPQIPESFKKTYNVVRSSRHFLEFLNPKSSKGFALQAISNHTGIDIHQMIAVGDAENDNHMIELAGLGVAMGNAMDSTKEVADYITLTNEQDGVASVIEKFVL